MNDLEKKLAVYEKENEELKHRVEELTDFFENASIPLHWVDGHGIIIWANQAELDLLGYTLEEYIGFPISSFHVDQEIIQDILTRLVNNETLYNYSAKLRCKDGSIIHVLINSNVLRKDGKFVHTRCFTRDITGIVLQQEKQKELMLKLEEQAALINSSSDAIIGKSVTGTVTSWNVSAECLFGYKNEEIIGKPIFTLIPTDRQDEEHRILSRLKAGDHIAHFETKRLHKTGKLLDVSLSISPIRDINGNVIGLSSIARDISERMLEEQRKHDFVAMVSHELKTPLTTINAYAQLLMANSASEESAFNLQVIPRIEAQAKKMIFMVHDFLSLARLGDGKIPLHKETFELEILVAEIAADITLLSPKHSIKFSGCEEVNLYADRDKIGQVLTNLVSNAVKYSPSGGTVSIGCEENSGKVRVYVTDQGVGISKADQERLFERFYRVNDSKLKGITGFGIGLYLVSEILRRHESKIKVESQEGKGSTFYFELDTTV